MSTRRQLLSTLGAGAVALPFASMAQRPGKVWRIGWLSAFGPVSTALFLSSFKEGMNALGYVEGKNLVIETRSAINDPERLQVMASELMLMKPDVFIVLANPAIRAAQKLASNIPIVMAVSADPVSSGFIQSLSRPGGNTTGITQMLTDRSSKLLELLHEVAPKVSRVAVLTQSTSTLQTQENEILNAAPALGMTAFSMSMDPKDRRGSFTRAVQQKANGVIVLTSLGFDGAGGTIAELAAAHKLPAIYNVSQYVEQGGLLSYGPSFTDLSRHSASYVDKIFKGAKPADLPVEQPTKIEMAVNLKTAKALGIKIPNSILIRADKVIE
jgi:putative ABC transport system substrate-binding protein